MNQTAKIILLIILSALIIGAGVYYLTDRAYKTEKQDLEARISQLQAQVEEIEQEEKSSEDLSEEQSEEESQETESSVVSNIPEGWNTYETNYVSFAYPDSYEFERKDNYGYIYFYESEPRSDSSVGGELEYGFYLKKIEHSNSNNLKSWVRKEYSNNAWVAENLRYSTKTINDYTVYQTESLPAHAGTFDSFFKTDYGYVQVSFGPYSSEDPFIDQSSEFSIYKRILKTVEIK